MHLLDSRRAAVLLSVSAVLLAATPVAAAGVQGTFIQTDNLGMNFVTHRLDTGKTTSVADAAALSEFIGLHYYVRNGLRVGLNLQFSELLSRPEEGASRFTTFALLPQVGWDFYGPMFVALIGTISPRAYGKNDTELGFQGLFGAGTSLARNLRGSLALEVPVNLRLRQSIGLTLIAGVAWKL